MFAYFHSKKSSINYQYLMNTKGCVRLDIFFLPTNGAMSIHNQLDTYTIQSIDIMQKFSKTHITHRYSG
jgi:hypothetical protein